MPRQKKETTNGKTSKNQSQSEIAKERVDLKRQLRSAGITGWKNDDPTAKLKKLLAAGKKPGKTKATGKKTPKKSVAKKNVNSSANEIPFILNWPFETDMLQKVEHLRTYLRINFAQKTIDVHDDPSQNHIPGDIAVYAQDDEGNERIEYSSKQFDIEKNSIHIELPPGAIEDRVKTCIRFENEQFKILEEWLPSFNPKQEYQAKLLQNQSPDILLDIQNTMEIASKPGTQILDFYDIINNQKFSGYHGLIDISGAIEIFLTRNMKLTILSNDLPILYNLIPVVFEELKSIVLYSRLIDTEEYYDEYFDTVKSFTIDPKKYYTSAKKLRSRLNSIYDHISPDDTKWKTLRVNFAREFDRHGEKYINGIEYNLNSREYNKLIDAIKRTLKPYDPVETANMLLTELLELYVYSLYLMTAISPELKLYGSLSQYSIYSDRSDDRDNYNPLHGSGYLYGYNDFYYRHKMSIEHIGPRIFTSFVQMAVNKITHYATNIGKKEEFINSIDDIEGSPTKFFVTLDTANTTLYEDDVGHRVYMVATESEIIKILDAEIFSIKDLGEKLGYVDIGRNYVAYDLTHSKYLQKKG